MRNYTGYEEWSAEPLCRREVPSADVTLILSPDSELRLPERHTSFVAALHDRCALVEHPGEQRGVEVRLTLTSPMCPVAGSLPPEVEQKVAEVAGVTASTVDLVWDPPWEPSMMSEAAKLELGMM